MAPHCSQDLVLAFFNTINALSLSSNFQPDIIKLAETPSHTTQGQRPVASNPSSFYKLSWKIFHLFTRWELFSAIHLQTASWSGERVRKMCLRMWCSSPSCSRVTKSTFPPILWNLSFLNPFLRQILNPWTLTGSCLVPNAHALVGRGARLLVCWWTGESHLLVPTSGAHAFFRCPNNGL